MLDKLNKITYYPFCLSDENCQSTCDPELRGLLVITVVLVE